MTLAIPDLATLDADQVAQVQAQLTELVAARFPAVDLSRGVVHDVVLHLAAILIAAEETNVDRLRRSQSLLAIAADPTLADDDTVDRVLANFRVVRDPGRPAVGQVTVVLDAAVPLVVPAGIAFTAGGVAFATPAAVAVRTAAAQATGPADRLLRPLGDGTYACSIPVACVTAGIRGMLRRGAALAPAFAIPHFVVAYAEADFTGGAAAETNADLLLRLQQGIAAPVCAGRVNVEALVRGTAEFRRTLALSIVGAGDAELVRAARGLLPVLLPGRADVYARTAALPQVVSLLKEAVLVAVEPAGGVWQFALGRAEAPGFYAVTRVAPPDRPPAEAGFVLVADVRSLDLTGGGWAPDLVDPVEGVYSAYQAAVVRFRDDRTPTAGLAVGAATAVYAVAVAALPQLAALQDFLGGRAVRPLGGDVLVKAPVPCFLSVSFAVRRRPGAPVPDRDAIAAAVADRVNGLGFPGQLHASLVAEEAKRFLADGVELGPIDLFGRLRRPDGTTAYLRDPLATVLAVPDEPDRMVTGRTVAFILDPADVAIALETIAVPEI